MALSASAHLWKGNSNHSFQEFYISLEIKYEQQRMVMALELFFMKTASLTCFILGHSDMGTRFTYADNMKIYIKSQWYWINTRYRRIPESQISVSVLGLKKWYRNFSNLQRNWTTQYRERQRYELHGEQITEAKTNLK